MGAWDYSSHGNDHVYDAFGFPISERVKAMYGTPLGGGVSQGVYDEAWKRTDSPECEAGVVILALILGFSPPVAHVNKAMQNLRALLKDAAYLEHWQDPDERREAIAGEIAFLREYLVKSQ